MYIDIGVDKVVLSDEIIGIFDLDNTTVSKTTRTTLNICEKNGSVKTLGYELPKSFVLCGKEKDDINIFLSPVSSQTIIKRTENFDRRNV
ncbi:MAG: DUF370 domain-containing protein [Clostridiales bacterium]|nr:DUF370 domain-containing protein [Clostridiales bacterium]